MKLLKTALFTAIVAIGTAQGATTITVKNFSNASTGVPILSSATADPVTTGSYAPGFFTTVPNWADATPQSILAAFTPFKEGSTWFRTGLFNVTLSQDLAPGDTAYTGKNIYTLVGNGATLAGSTTMAVFLANPVVKFPIVPGTGLATASSVTEVANEVVYGRLMTPHSQSSITGSSYAQGVQLVPEASTALLGALGALGLLRRRR